MPLAGSGGLAGGSFGRSSSLLYSTNKHRKQEFSGILILHSAATQLQFRSGPQPPPAASFFGYPGKSLQQKRSWRVLAHHPRLSIKRRRRDDSLVGLGFNPDRARRAKRSAARGALRALKGQALGKGSKADSSLRRRPKVPDTRVSRDGVERSGILDAAPRGWVKARAQRYPCGTAALGCVLPAHSGLGGRTAL